MKIKKYEIKKLQWDSLFFGINSAKVILNEEITKNEIKEIIENLKTNNYKFITIQNINNNSNNNFILKEFNNIFLADVNIQFIKDIDLKTKIKDVCNEIIIETNVAFNEEILDISKKSFKYSRFIDDKNLKKGNQVYCEWTKNAFNKSEKYFAIYKHIKKIIGYALFSVFNNELVIELIAIDDKYKGNGIGHKIISSIESYAMQNRINKIKVGTQINNIKAQNFYVSCGFKHNTNHSIYHCWL